MDDIPVCDDPARVSKQFKSKLMQEFFKNNFKNKRSSLPLGLAEHRSGSMVTFSNQILNEEHQKSQVNDVKPSRNIILS